MIARKLHKSLPVCVSVYCVGPFCVFPRHGLTCESPISCSSESVFVYNFSQPTSFCVITRPCWIQFRLLVTTLRSVISRCLSVCLSRLCTVLKRQKVSTRFLLHMAADVSPDHFKIWFTSDNPFLYKFCPKVTHPAVDLNVGVLR